MATGLIQEVELLENESGDELILSIVTEVTATRKYPKIAIYDPRPGHEKELLIEVGSYFGPASQNIRNEFQVKSRIRKIF